MSAPGVVIGTSIVGNHEISAGGYRSSLDLINHLEMKQNTNFDLASLTKIIATTSIECNFSSKNSTPIKAKRMTVDTP